MLIVCVCVCVYKYSVARSGVNDRSHGSINGASRSRSSRELRRTRAPHNGVSRGNEEDGGTNEPEIKTGRYRGSSLRRGLLRDGSRATRNEKENCLWET